MRGIFLDAEYHRWTGSSGLPIFINVMSLTPGFGGYSTDPKRMQAEHVLAVHKYREGGKYTEEKRWMDIFSSLGTLKGKWQSVVSETCRLFGEDSESLLNASEYLPAVTGGLKGAANWNFESGCKKKFKDVFLPEMFTATDSSDDLTTKRALLPLPTLVTYDDWKSKNIDLTDRRVSLIQREVKARSKTSLADAIADSVSGVPSEAAAILVSNLCADNCSIARDILRHHFPLLNTTTPNNIVECLTLLGAERGRMISDALKTVMPMDFLGDANYAALIDREVNPTFLSKSLSSIKVPPPPSFSEVTTGKDRVEALKAFKTKWPSVIAQVANWEQNWLRSCGYVPVWEVGKPRTYRYDPFIMRGTIKSRFEALEQKLRDLQNTSWNPLSESKMASEALGKAAAYIVLKDINHALSEVATKALMESYINEAAKDRADCANAFGQLLCDMGYGSDIYALVAACYNINLILYEDARSPKLYSAREDQEKQKLAIVSKLPQDEGYAAVRLNRGNSDLVTSPMRNHNLQAIKQSGFELPPRALKPQWLRNVAMNKVSFSSNR